MVCIGWFPHDDMSDEEDGSAVSNFLGTGGRHHQNTKNSKELFFKRGRMLARRDPRVHY